MADSTNASSSKILKRKEVSDSRNLKNKKNRIKQENDDLIIDQLMQIKIEERKMALQEQATADQKVQRNLSLKIW